MLSSKRLRRGTALALALASALTLTAIAGCDDAPSGSHNGPPAVGPEPTPEPMPGPMPDEPVTYTEHIRPLIAETCLGCHRMGGSTPFALESYAQAQPWAAALANAVQARRMPPHLADTTGACGTFRSHLWLTDAQIARFVDWAAAGAPEGDPSPAPALPAAAELSGDVAIVDIGGDYLPDQTKTDDYRCFVVESPGTFDVSGFRVVPGNPRIVHHLIGYRTVDPVAAAEARRLDALSPALGYDCLGTGPGVDATGLVSWTPGVEVELFPDGIGVPIVADLPLIFEVHYNTAGGPGETDRTTIELQRAPADSLNPMFELIAIDESFVGPPGDAAFTTTSDLPVSWQIEVDHPERIRLLGANAHMHQRGVSQRIELVRPDGSTRCLLDIPRWDFDWQLNYWYAAPIDIAAEDTLRITCTFDTRGIAEPLRWGEGTNDEMCLGSVYAYYPQ